MQQQYLFHAHSSMLWMYWQIYSAKTKHININVPCTVYYHTKLSESHAELEE